MKYAVVVTLFLRNFFTS